MLNKMKTFINTKNYLTLDSNYFNTYICKQF